MFKFWFVIFNVEKGIRFNAYYEVESRIRNEHHKWVYNHKVFVLTKLILLRSSDFLKSFRQELALFPSCKLIAFLVFY